MSAELPRALFFGGLIGSGKSTLAGTVSSTLDAHVYNLDAVKEEIYPTDPDHNHNMAHGIPFSDATREKVFRKAIEDFQELSATHERVIIEETLHKRSFRDILYAGAQEHFGTYGVVWVRSDKATALSRLEARSRAGHILQDPARMYAGFVAVFEPIVEADVVHDNSGPLDESAAQLVHSLRTYPWSE